MLICYQGQVGLIVSIPLSGELEAIGFSSEVRFEFLLFRNNQPTAFPLGLEQFNQWRLFDPLNAEPCYSLLYPSGERTRGLDAEGLGVQTRGLFAGAVFTLFVWTRE